MKVLLILSLMYPGESFFEEVKRVEVTDMHECYATRRALAQELAGVVLPKGFQYVTECSDSAAPADGAQAGWILQNYDKDPTRIKKK